MELYDILQNKKLNRPLKENIFQVERMEDKSEK